MSFVIIPCSSVLPQVYIGLCQIGWFVIDCNEVIVYVPHKCPNFLKNCKNLDVMSHLVSFGDEF